jgi:hypothetical protein
VLSGRSAAKSHLRAILEATKEKQDVKLLVNVLVKTLDFEKQLSMR